MIQNIPHLLPHRDTFFYDDHLCHKGVLGSGYQMTQAKRVLQMNLSVMFKRLYFLTLAGGHI